MSECYYTLLKVERDATPEQINTSYKKIAARTHPDKHMTKPEREQLAISAQFVKLREAAELLLDAEKRSEYDSFGCEQWTKGSVYYPFNPCDMSTVYRYTEFVQKPRPKTAPRTYEVAFKLSDLYYGRIKNINIKRKLFVDGVQVDSPLPVPIQMDILPGYKSGTAMTFYGAGDETRPNSFADIRFEIKEIPHEVFERDGDTLTTTLDISAKEGLFGFTRIIKAINGEDVMVSTKDLSITGREFRFPGFGMPIRKQPGAFGDLIVFLLVEELNDEQRDRMADMF